MKILRAIKKYAQSDRIALTCDGVSMTYKELDRISESIAAFLLKECGDDRTPIILYGNKENLMMAVMMGALKSGRAYVPIDISYPKERVETILSEVKSKVLFDFSEGNEFKNTKVLYEKDVEEIASEFSNIDVEEDKWVNGDENAYILFTSGSTGKPKGVQISSNNLDNFVEWMADYLKLDESEEVFMNQAAYSFDLSVTSIYPGLCYGKTLHGLSKKTLSNLKNMFEDISNSNINIWVSTPSFAQMCFLDKTFDAEHHPDLTHFLFCGEELPHSEADMLKKKFPESHIFNTYGPTETTVAVTQVEITDEILEKYDRLPIGKVKEDTKITIDTSKGDKPGEGEIIISGPSVSKGYMNNPEKTEAAFFQNEGDKYRSYRSGDAGFFDGDMLFYRGRIDFQIKFNGYRIELEEINFYLSKNEFVRYGVAAPKYNKDHTVKQIVAEIELKHGVRRKYSDAQLTKLIREDLAKNVMPYMIPQRYVYQDSLPISQNGKVDIKAVIKEVNK